MKTGLWDNVAGLGLVPIVLWLMAIGYGLLIERIMRVRLSNALLVPTGFCAGVVVSLGAFATGIGDALAVPAVVAPPVLGFLLAWRELPVRLNAGWPLLAAVATYVLFDLSVLATGHWTFTGYNIENDSAYELVLISHLQAHGAQIVPGPPSTAKTVVDGYLTTGYPLGTQSLLAVLSGLLGVPAVALWQGFISSMAAIGTIAAASLSERMLGPRLAAAAAFVALASALFYQYALQGAIKEVGEAVTVLSVLALGRHAIVSLRGTGAAVVAAIPLAALLAIFNAAGLPYLGALVGTGVVALLLVRRRWPAPEWLPPALTGMLVLAILAIPTLLTIGTFFKTATAGYGSAHPTAPVLGPLLRPLPLSEISGVWLYGDYRFPVPAGAAGRVTVIVTVIIFVLLAPAIWRMFRAREPGLLVGLAAMVVVLVVVYPRVVPYAQAKLLMIASPIVVLACLQGLSGLRPRWGNALAIGLAAVIGGTVLASDALAYHNFPVAPVGRLLALRQIGQRLGPRGPVLDSEFEQFAKYFMLPALLIDGPDAPTPVQLALRTPAPEYDQSFDLNQEALPFVESFPYVLTRRSPVTSPPPANFRVVLSNSFYQLWQRQPSPGVDAHLPLGGEGVSAGARPGCRSLRSLVRGARPGTELVAESLPPVIGYELSAAAVRSPGWSGPGHVPGGFTTDTPGLAERRVQVLRSGRYLAWVEGDFPRVVYVTLDGHRVGSVKGNNTPGGWLEAGAVSVGAGSRLLGVERPGGGLGPGNGDTQAEIDAVALVPAGQSPRTSVVPVSRWRSLCAREADWVELVDR